MNCLPLTKGPAFTPPLLLLWSILEPKSQTHHALVSKFLSRNWSLKNVKCFNPCIQTLQDPHCHTENHRTSKPENWNLESNPQDCHTSETEILLCSPKSSSSHGDVFLPPTASIPVNRRLLHLPGEVEQLEVHDERQVRKPLPGLLPTPLRLPETVRRDLQCVRPACEALPEAAHQLESALGPRCRCQGWAGSQKLCQGSYSYLFFLLSISCKKPFKVRRRESCRERALKRKHVFRRQKRESSSISSDEAVLSDGGSQLTSASGLEADSRVSDFIDLSFWKRKEICCGTIFVGPSGEPKNTRLILNPT